MTDQFARGVFATSNGQRYVTQLSKHWSHKPGTVINEQTSTITFENGNSVAFDILPDQLGVVAHTPADGDLTHWQSVVETHLKRFAFREDFNLKWSTGAV